MWIILLDLFLIKKLLKNEVCEFHEQCMRPTYIAEMCIVHWKKINNCRLKRKKGKRKMWMCKTWIQTAPKYKFGILLKRRKKKSMRLEDWKQLVRHESRKMDFLFYYIFLGKGSWLLNESANNLCGSHSYVFA